MKILMTGGSGLLGTELRKYIDCECPSRKVMDITDPKTFLYNDYTEIIHCAAYTNVVEAESKGKDECFKVNVVGTNNLVEAFPNSKFVFISSEDVYHPVNFYSKTKVMAENIVRKHPNHLIIRTGFTPRPFKYDVAFFDKYTREDYVDIIAPMILSVIFEGSTGTVDIGTERKTLFELARRSKPDILATTVKDCPIPLPTDYE